MASVAVRCGGGGVTCSVRQEWRNWNRLAPSKIGNSTFAMAIGGGRKEMTMNPISCALSTSSTTASRLETKRKRRRQEESVSHENVIDEWMRDSVVEIVKNLRDAPLFVHVYSDGGGDGSARRLRTEKAAPDDWLTMKTEWENGTTPKPDGVIFVEQLRETDEVVEEESLSETSRDFAGASEITRAWGVVVQGRGENCGPSCYLLKTSRAGAGPGLGLCCTHFCLVKVKSFRQTAEAHFKNCWLLNAK